MRESQIFHLLQGQTTAILSQIIRLLGELAQVKLLGNFFPNLFDPLAETLFRLGLCPFGPGKGLNPLNQAVNPILGVVAKKLCRTKLFRSLLAEKHPVMLLADGQLDHLGLRIFPSGNFLSHAFLTVLHKDNGLSCLDGRQFLAVRKGFQKA